MSPEETPAETIKQLQVRLAAAEAMIEMQKIAAPKNMANTMQDLVGELNAENEAAKILVDKLKKELIAERATSSLLRREKEQLEQLEFQLEAAEEFMNLHQKAAQQKRATTTSGVQVLTALVGELNAEKAVAQILVEKLTKELIAEKATSSLLRTETSN